MSTTNACCGSMFPNLDSLRPNEPSTGRVLSVTLRHDGLGPVGRETTVDVAAWEECRACGDYRACYELGMAKLLLQLGVRLSS